MNLPPFTRLSVYGNTPRISPDIDSIAALCIARPITQEKSLTVGNTLM